jgi:hypothetical protein
MNPDVDRSNRKERLEARRDIIDNECVWYHPFYLIDLCPDFNSYGVSKSVLKYS